MSFEREDIVMLVAGASVFGLVLSLWLMAMLFAMLRQHRQRHEIQQRLGLDEDSLHDGRILRLWRDGKSATTFVTGPGGPRGMINKVDYLLKEAGYTRPASTMLMLLLALMGAAALVVMAVTGNVIASLSAAVAMVLIFFTILRRRIARRQAIFDQQLLDALELAARSLRAGHPLGGAFHLIAEEIPAPVGTAFSEICEQEDLGVSHEESMRRVAERTFNSDMKLFSTAVAIQLRSGGNLADMMERLAAVIRDRMRLSRRVRVLTAQARLSKNFLLALPFVMFVLLSVLNPDYMATLYQTQVGRLLLVGGGISLLLGALIMNRVATIRY